MKRKFLHLVFLITICGFLSAQSITNVQSKQEGNTIAVTYDLQCDGDSHIGLFISEDGSKNFTGPLKSVSGDVGPINPGITKKIVWDVTKDKDVLFGKNIVFRVKAMTDSSISEAVYASMIPINGTFTDSRDGKTYKTINIGTQTWMAENLNYSTSSGSWCYDNNKSNCDKYGRLYDWQTSQNVCPSGWRLPSKNDFEMLINNVSDSGSNAYSSLIESGNSGFLALLGGWRGSNGRFHYFEKYGSWWSSSENDIDLAWCLVIYSGNQFANMLSYQKELGYSVRCIKN
jgi:uncharacterized protein (TIGR02145 family)